MRVVVTGCAGFIGSHLCEALLGRGDAVLGIDDLNDYYDVRQKDANLGILRPSDKFSFLEADIRDGTVGESIAAFKPDAIVHLAARAGVRPSIKEPRLYYETNVLGTLNMLEAARAAGMQTFIFGSSSSVYGNREGGQFSEEDRVDMPQSPYAATKKAGEELCYTYHALHGINVTCLRFFTVYGPRGRPDMAPYLFTRAILDGRPIKRFGDGTSARDYTYVVDIVQGVVAALDKALPYEVLNLGNKHPVCLNDFIEAVQVATGKKATIEQLPPQPGDVPYTCADITKAHHLLGYAPKTSIEQGLKALVDWLR